MNTNTSDNINIADSGKYQAAAKSYQLVAQSAALAVQDATHQLRNLNTVSIAALGMGLANYLSSGNKDELEGLTKEVKAINEGGINGFTAVGNNAREILRGFSTNA